jgi:hypothetical protein
VTIIPLTLMKALAFPRMEYEKEDMLILDFAPAF